MKIFLALFFVVFQSIGTEKVDKETAVKECLSELSINAGKRERFFALFILIVDIIINVRGKGLEVHRYR